MDSREKRKGPPQQFISTFGFDEDDLAANLQGRLSERQRARLSGTFARNVSFLTVLIVVALWLLIISLALPLRGTTGVRAPNGALGLLLLLILVLARPVTIRLTYWIRVGIDLASLTVRVAEGYPQIVEKGSFRDTRYHLAIGGESLRISDEALPLFEVGVHYRICYLPRSQRILSAQVLPDVLH